VNSKASVLAALQIPNPTFPVIVELDPVPLALAVVTEPEPEVMTVSVDHAVEVDTALAVMDTVTVALLHLAATMTTTTVVAIVPRPELAPQSMTTRLPAVVASMIPIAATTLRPIRMSMADHLHETTLPEITLQEMPAMLTMIVVLAIDCFLFEKYVLCDSRQEGSLHIRHRW